jgi:hypothetical protein
MSYAVRHALLETSKLSKNQNSPLSGEHNEKDRQSTPTHLEPRDRRAKFSALKVKITAPPAFEPPTLIDLFLMRQPP